MSDIVNGRYELLESLGQGGYGAVYRAHDKTLDRFVALKQLHALGFGPQVKERFLEEARISSQLTHPSALMIFDFGVSEFGDPYLVSELLKGLSLYDYLKHKVCSAAQTLNILIEVTGVLSEAHSIGIVHRDLKPANLYLHIPPAKQHQAEAQIKLLDFGIAKVMQQEGGGATKSGAIVGTPAYIAPEQIKDSSKVNHLCDQYSLGLVAWSALHGRRPFVGENEFELMHKQLNEDLPPLYSKSDGADELYEVIQRMCAKLPEERYESTAHLLETLESLKAKSKAFASKTVISLEGMVIVESHSAKNYTSSKSQSLKFSSLQKSARTRPTPMTVQRVGLESFMETMDFEADQTVSPNLQHNLSYEECLDQTIIPSSDIDESTLDLISSGQTAQLDPETAHHGAITEQDHPSERSSLNSPSLSTDQSAEGRFDPSESSQVDINSIPNQSRLILYTAVGGLIILIMIAMMWTSEKKSQTSKSFDKILKPLSSAKKPLLGGGRKFSRHRVILLPKQSGLGYAIGSEIEVMVENRLGTPQDFFKVLSVPQCLKKISDPSRQLYRVISESCGEITVKVNQEEISTTIRAQTLLDDALGDLE